MSGKNPNVEEQVVIADEDEDGEEEISTEAIPTAYLKPVAEDEFATPWDKIAYDTGIPTKKASGIIRIVREASAGRS